MVTKLMARYSTGNSAASSGMEYGMAVSISGNYAVVGAPLDSYDATGGSFLSQAGSAFILFNDAGTWKPVKKLVAPTRRLIGRFGAAVAVDGQYLVIGASDEDGEFAVQGAAYIFGRDQGGAGNWGLIKRIQARTPRATDKFGSAVDISGDYIAVATRWDDLDSTDNNVVEDAGAAFIFERNHLGANNWGMVKKISPNIRAAYDNFGHSVAIDGDLLIVGAPGEDEDAQEANSLSYAGAAYVFRKDQGWANNWGQVTKIVPAHRASDDQFGGNVDISGNRAIVSAWFADKDQNGLNPLSNAGAAYIFGKDQGGTDMWGQTKQITASPRVADGWFGTSVAMDGGFAVVGSAYESLDSQGQNFKNSAGAVYLFGQDQGGAGSWGLVNKYYPSTRVANDGFGKAVALDGGHFLAASYGFAQDPGDVPVPNAGAVYVFKQEPALPVTLASFSVSRVENQAYLQWTTAAEIGTSYFEIQKSLNARDWAPIGMREAARDSDMPVHYTHWDNQLTAGNVYYRLKMVDLDGTFAYSGIRSLLGGNGAELVAFPNPVTDRIFIKAAGTAAIASVEIRNTAGQLMYKTDRVDGQGIAVSKFAPGTYVVQIRNADGTSVTRKMTIGK